MIHLYPMSGGHISFKKMAPFTSVEEIAMEDGDVLWICPAFVGWKNNSTQFIMLPWAKIENVHVIRKIGDDWLDASGG
jgi:hypothetical protein